MKKQFKICRLKIWSILSVCFFSSSVNAQTWSAAGSGLDNNLYSFVTDQNNNVLYAAGHFDTSGATPVHRIAKWDGTNWSALGNGMDQDVFAVTMYNGELYAGGHFTIADGNSCSYIARWDGTTWQPVGTGMDNDVYCLQVYNGELYAGGIFTLAGGNSAERIARWDGTNWNALGSGIDGGTMQVFSLQVFNAELYAGGNFTDAGGVSVNAIAKWDGINWSEVNGSVSGGGNVVYDLAVYNNNLIITGAFDTAGNITANGIGKWDGLNWTDIGTGLSGAGGFGVVLSVYNGELYLGGDFTSVDGVPANRIARYNQINGWRDLGAGCDQEVDALEVYAGELFVGGAFYSGGGIGLLKIGKWSSGCTAAAATSGQNISCFGTCDGSVSVASAGNAPFTYLWSNNDTNDVVSGLCPGSYTVTVTDSSGCVAVDSVTIIEFALPSVSLSGTSPVCTSQCNGSAVATATGRIPFTYSWSTIPVQTSDTATGLCAGFYLVTVTDSAGCSVIDSITIADPIMATLNFSTTSTICAGRCDGTATVNTTSPNSPYTYDWSTNPLQNTQTAIDLCAGSYIVTVTDSIGCSVTDSVMVDDSPPFVLSFFATSPSCPLSCNGTTVVSSNSAYPPFTYLWNTSPTQNTDTAIALCEGIYTATVIDSLGCVSTDSVALFDPVISLSVSSTDATCFGGGCDGSATAVASGLTLFSYVWSINDSTNSISNLCPGNYSVVATDSSGCILVDSVVISISPAPSLSLSSVSPLCFGDCNGSATANASGSSMLTYLWSTNDTTSSISNVCFGWYSVTVSDSLGCASNDSLLVLQPDPLDIMVSSTLNITCNGNCDGAISIIASGGTASYNYLWSNNNTFPDQFNLCADTYTLTVTDVNGCTKQSAITLTQPDSLIVLLTSTDATCQGCNDGTLTVNTSGGTFPYSFFFTPSVPDLGHVTAGTYFLCVTDSGGCQACDSTIVSEPNGVFELSDSEVQLSVYPNPFNSTAIIRIPASVKNTNSLNISFYSLIGMELDNIPYFVNKSNSREIIIQRGALVSGMYLFKVSSKEEVIGTGRFMVN